MKRILITGCAGFIGSNLTDKLLNLNCQVVGIDNLNNYYNLEIKEANIDAALKNEHFKFYREDILNFDGINKIFKKEQPLIVVHLAARAGVRPSIVNPKLYGEVNIVGTVNLLKLSADHDVKKFIFASSSSVYGNSRHLPFVENDSSERIISPYGASKVSAEYFVESFYKSTGLKCTILRFFTVYGPRGRPDMAPALFAKAILKGTIIDQFGDGSSGRDYTYIDDVVDGIVKALEKNLDFEVINLGNSNPVKLSDFIKTIEKITGKKATVNIRENQPGDVERTWANIEKAKQLLEWKPQTDLYEGLEKYIMWLQIK